MKPWTALTIAAVGAGVTLFVAAVVQQNYRQSANDPQIQLAEDGATAFGNGANPADIVGGRPPVEAATSLAPFMTVFDADKRVLATSGRFVGETLTPPAGTFDYARAHGQDRFTWQTTGGAREAAVLVYANGQHTGYVLAARSLHEVEAREGALRLMTIITLAGIALLCGVYMAASK